MHGSVLYSQVAQTLSGDTASILPSVRDLPGLEAYNKLDVSVRLSVSPEVLRRVYEENLHGVELGEGADKLVHMVVPRSRSQEMVRAEQACEDEVKHGGNFKSWGSA